MAIRISGPSSVMDAVNQEYPDVFDRIGNGRTDSALDYAFAQSLVDRGLTIQVSPDVLNEKFDIFFLPDLGPHCRIPLEDDNDDLDWGDDDF